MKLTLKQRDSIMVAVAEWHNVIKDTEPQNGFEWIADKIESILNEPTPIKKENDQKEL